jgi:hypothetical protein
LRRLPDANMDSRRRELTPETKIILLSMHTEAPYVLEAMQAGAVSYVLKTQATRDPVQAIRDVLRGEVYWSPRVYRTVVTAVSVHVVGTRNSDEPTPRSRNIAPQGRQAAIFPSAVGPTPTAVQDYLKALEARVAALESGVQGLEAKGHHLTEHVQQNSRHASRSPSSAPPQVPGKPGRREASGGRPGGQPGPEGPPEPWCRGRRWM